MNCWICGGKAETGEHRIKKTDLEILFSGVTQKRPVFGRAGQHNIEKMGTLKSKKFHFDSRLCRNCNSSLTQPLDRAWDKLSKYLHKNMASNKLRGSIKLHKIYPGCVNESMLNAHLFFIKSFGCYAAESNMSVPIVEFADCIKNSSAHPSIYIGFGYLQKETKKNMALMTPIETVSQGNKIQAANWQYVIGNVYVDIMYALEGRFAKVAKNLWHPSNKTKILKLGKLQTNYNVF